MPEFKIASGNAMDTDNLTGQEARAGISGPRFQGPFFLHDKTLILALISNHMLGEI